MASLATAARRVLRSASRATLARRPDDWLPFVEAGARSPASILLDTCVYIDEMQGRLPAEAERLFEASQINHSAIAVQELMFSMGALDPRDRRTRRAIDTIERTLDLMPPYRLFAPDLGVLATAAVHAGILARVQGYARDDRKRALNDCVLFLQALKLGLTVLTRNVRDFDLLLQLRPEGRVLFYRT